MQARRIIAGLLALALTVPPGMAPAQDLIDINGRQCAAEGTELFASLEEQIPGCDLYCTVDKANVPGFETYPGEVFACADRRGVLVVDDSGRGGSGLAGAAGLGALVGLGLLLAVSGGGSRGGATVNTGPNNGR